MVGKWSDFRVTWAGGCENVVSSLSAALELASWLMRNMDIAVAQTVRIKDVERDEVVFCALTGVHALDEWANTQAYEKMSHQDWQAFKMLSFDSKIASLAGIALLRGDTQGWQAAEKIVKLIEVVGRLALPLSRRLADQVG
jgi:hypothetical protein